MRACVHISSVGERREKKVLVDDPAQLSFRLGLTQRDGEGFERNVFEASRVELTPPLPMQKYQWSVSLQGIRLLGLWP